MHSEPQSPNYHDIQLPSVELRNAEDLWTFSDPGPSRIFPREGLSVTLCSGLLSPTSGDPHLMGRICEVVYCDPRIKELIIEDFEEIRILEPWVIGSPYTAFRETLLSVLMASFQQSGLRWSEYQGSHSMALLFWACCRNLIKLELHNIAFPNFPSNNEVIIHPLTTLRALSLSFRSQPSTYPEPTYPPIMPLLLRLFPSLAELRIECVAPEASSHAIQQARDLNGEAFQSFRPSSSDFDCIAASALDLWALNVPCHVKSVEIDVNARNLSYMTALAPVLLSIIQPEHLSIESLDGTQSLLESMSSITDSARDMALMDGHLWMPHTVNIIINTSSAEFGTGSDTVLATVLVST